jgi:hypothetical protein
MSILGNHQTLMDAKGVYYGLVEAQNLHMKSDNQKEVEDDDMSSMRKHKAVDSAVSKLNERHYKLVQSLMS